MLRCILNGISFDFVKCSKPEIYCNGVIYKFETLNGRGLVFCTFWKDISSCAYLFLARMKSLELVHCKYFTWQVC